MVPSRLSITAPSRFIIKLDLLIWNQTVITRLKGAPHSFVRAWVVRENPLRVEVKRKESRSIEITFVRTVSAYFRKEKA